MRVYTCDFCNESMDYYSDTFEVVSPDGLMCFTIAYYTKQADICEDCTKELVPLIEKWIGTKKKVNND